MEELLVFPIIIIIVIIAYNIKQKIRNGDKN